VRMGNEVQLSISTACGIRHVPVFHLSSMDGIQRQHHVQGWHLAVDCFHPRSIRFNGEQGLCSYWPILMADF
ncbi:hypothetical protein, partial [Stenotrophomonas sp. HMWF023]|uniref:hypothetical protein n=1 Tax=Stenotrophomonas sp. HMWF023 TaxID=2056859 RepID=UPI001C639CC9